MKRKRPFSLESLENRQLLTAFSSHQVSADEEDPSNLEWAVSGSHATDEQDPDNLEWSVQGSYGTNNDSATDAVFAKAAGW